ncbi:MAG: hypothetical protein EPN47_19785 [Acidobacteria bacterium]|nr:MAG: hypothetical protein EPN47_19785 [Acidobacteriota bacterium]
MPILIAPPVFSSTEQVFHSRAGLLARMVRRVLRHPADTEDIVRQSFVNALAHLNLFRADSALNTWFARIVINNEEVRYVHLNNPDRGRCRFSNCHECRACFDGHGSYVRCQVRVFVAQGRPA